MHHIKLAYGSTWWERTTDMLQEDTQTDGQLMLWHNKRDSAWLLFWSRALSMKSLEMAEVYVLYELPLPVGLPRIL